MTIAPHTRVPAEQQWNLTDKAWGQLTGCGITLAELYRLLRKPDLKMPAGPNTPFTRYTGYGLTVEVDERGTENSIVSIGLDGASSGNWEDWAEERAYFQDGDTAGADALVATELAVQLRQQRQRTQRRERAPEPEQAPVTVTRIPTQPAQSDQSANAPVRPWSTPTITTGRLPLWSRTTGVVPEKPAPVRVQPPDDEELWDDEEIPLSAGRRATTGHVLDRIHPALHAEVTRQAAGDWSRVVVHSYTNVIVNPAANPA